MSSEVRLTIVTGYHFNSTESEAYERLLRSLKASLEEVGEKGRIILVASGTESDAENPDRVIRDLNPPSSARIEPVSLPRSLENVGMWNAGIGKGMSAA